MPSHSVLCPMSRDDLPSKLDHILDGMASDRIARMEQAVAELHWMMIGQFRHPSFFAPDLFAPGPVATPSLRHRYAVAAPSLHHRRAIATSPPPHAIAKSLSRHHAIAAPSPRRRLCFEVVAPRQPAAAPQPSYRTHPFDGPPFAH